MASTPKTKKRKFPKQYVVRFIPNERDLRTLDFLAAKKALTYSSVIRLALAECAERSGFQLGPDFSSNLREPANHVSG